jgi:hypothetical protein
MVILYLETNFLMSIATGRDAEASELLADASTGITRALPQICFMEALTALLDERRRRNSFSHQINQELVQSRRDLTSSHAAALRAFLDGALIENERLLEDTDARLFDAVELLSQRAVLIPLSSRVLDKARGRILIEDPTDNLILHNILDHAHANPADVKVLLSGNRKDFGTEAVRGALQEAGIDKYFTDAKNALGWYRSQPQS